MSLEAVLLLLLIILSGCSMLMTAAVGYMLLRRPTVEPATIEAALSTSWLKLGLAEKIGNLTTYAQDIRHDYRALDQMLRVPTARGALGELALESLLSDELAPDMFAMRQALPTGAIPDAQIRSTVGLICIDSKFVLDNYRAMVETANPRSKAAYKKLFLRDVQRHLDKIAADYVRPEEGTAPFALAYIPAESVYWFLTTEALDLLRRYTRQGVQLVSPLTLAHRVALIKAGVFDQKLAEEARHVKLALQRLERRFNQLDEEWRILHHTHLGNFSKKAIAVDGAYQQLRADFEQLVQPLKPE